MSPLQSPRTTGRVRIHRTPMLGLDRRWTVYFDHPVNGQPFERPCVTRWGARLYARRVERAYRAKERSDA